MAQEIQVHFLSRKVPPMDSGSPPPSSNLPEPLPPASTFKDTCDDHEPAGKSTIIFPSQGQQISNLNFTSNLHSPWSCNLVHAQLPGMQLWMSL